VLFRSVVFRHRSINRSVSNNLWDGSFV